MKRKGTETSKFGVSKREGHNSDLFYSNVANVGRRPYIPYHSLIINIMLEIGFLMRGEIIWNKNASAGTSTAWGSWQSASNPTLRDVHEYILVFSKDKFRRIKDRKEDTISRNEFLDFTKSIWEFPAFHWH